MKAKNRQRLVLEVINHRYGRQDQSTRPSMTRPSNCQSPLRVEGDKAQDHRRLVLQIADHRCGIKTIKQKTVDNLSSKLPITTAGPSTTLPPDCQGEGIYRSQISLEMMGREVAIPFGVCLFVAATIPLKSTESVSNSRQWTCLRLRQWQHPFLAQLLLPK